MQLQHHLSKISWTLADKTLYVIYGFVFLFQISLLSSEDLALFGILLAINTWIFVLSDSFALQSIIQFGFKESDKAKVNLYAAGLHIFLVLTLSLFVYLGGNVFASIFSEPRFLEITVYLPILSLLMIPRAYSMKIMLRDHNINRIFWSNFTFFGVMVFRIISFKLDNNSMLLEDAISIYLEGTLLSSAISLIINYKELKFSRYGEITIKKIMSFSLPFTITNAIYTIPKYLDIIILKLFFPLEQIGIYSAAKSLFRFFEEGMNGVNGLVYPASVRAVANNDPEALKSIVSKAISFTLVAFIIGSLILVSGFAEFLINFFMKERFVAAILHFEIMLLATLFLPFNMLYFIITASGKHLDLMKIVFYSITITFIAFAAIGFIGNETFMPLGYVSFYLSFAVISFNYVNKNSIIHLEFNDLFRSLNDTIKFIQKKLNK